MAMDEEDFIGMAQDLESCCSTEVPPLQESRRKVTVSNPAGLDSEPHSGKKDEKQQLLIPGLIPAIVPESDKVLINYINDGEDPRIIYDRLVLEIAEEALHLKHLRQAVQAMGLPFNAYSKDRVAALKDLSNIMAAKAKEVAARGGGAGGAIDFGSPEFRRVMAFLIAQVMESASATQIPEHSIKLMASALQQRLNGFEEKARDLYYDKAAVKGDMLSRKGEG